MTAVSGAAAARCLQILQLATGTISSVLQTAVIAIKSTYQLVWPQPPKSLVGEVVLVTGAGHGIGRHLALEFWEQGSTVICVDIDEESNQFTAKAINSRHCLRQDRTGHFAVDAWGPARVFTCDVTDRHQVVELAHNVLKDLGRVDVLVNSTDHHVQTPDMFVDVVTVNLFSNFWTLMAFLPGMVQRNHGHVVAISPVAGPCPLSNIASHCSVTGLMDALSEELCPDTSNVRVTCVHSCFVDTRPQLPEQQDIRIQELSLEQAARDIVSAVRHNKDAVTVPQNLLFWLSVIRKMPQGVKDIWQDLFHVQLTPHTMPYSSEVVSNETWI